ncbi:shikimate kinase [Marinobacter sp. TBZ242]|uniref:Shikimate kinase n=1 Tax=Marinobacter azerbaijanicus TaxID=3050455 RepID=A0ABT7IDM6_9GAMM|nr:shikimate kinase [Marinobacter sp. TBZ242]MDL0432249.1 shikimate kinase [Marinobacter sp. TBZ242]
MSTDKTSSNVVLIGMPGSGKSTVGVLLAKRLGLGFIDTDLLIQQETGRTLQEIVDGDGYRALRDIEERVLLKLDVQQQVISTGGSAVYSEPAMQHLKAGAFVVFLDIPLQVVLERIGDYSARGISRRPDQSLEELFAERFELYSRFADITVDCVGRNQEEVCDAVLAALAKAREGH